MTLDELKAERARIDREIEKLSGLNFDVGKARLIHYKQCELNEFRIKVRFDDPHFGNKYSYKEIFRYREQFSDDDDILGYVDDGIDEIIESLQGLKKELHKRWELN